MVDSEIDTVDQIKPKDEDTVIIRLLNLYLQKLLIVFFGHFKVAYAMPSLLRPCLRIGVEQPMSIVHHG